MFLFSVPRAPTKCDVVTFDEQFNNKNAPSPSNSAGARRFLGIKSLRSISITSFFLNSVERILNERLFRYYKNLQVSTSFSYGAVLQVSSPLSSFWFATPYRGRFSGWYEATHFFYTSSLNWVSYSHLSWSSYNIDLWNRSWRNIWRWETLFLFETALFHEAAGLNSSEIFAIFLTLLESAFGIPLLRFHVWIKLNT